MNALDERDDEDEPRSAGWTFDLAELEHDCALVLLDDIEKEHGLAFLAGVTATAVVSARASGQSCAVVIGLSWLSWPADGSINGRAEPGGRWCA
jgi:hypothetical protein